MPDHESAFSAWLESQDTKREMEIIRRAFMRDEYTCELTRYEVMQLALQMEILVALNIYADDPPIVEGDFPDRDDDDPWQTGWKPSQN